MKDCKGCKKEKTLTNFYKDNSTKDGHQKQCIECDKKRKKGYNKNYDDRVCYLCRQWYKPKYFYQKFCKVKCHTKHYTKIWLKSFRGIESQRKYYKENRELILLKWKLYYENNKEKKRKYYQANREDFLYKAKMRYRIKKYGINGL